jgi:hypothetical protein
LGFANASGKLALPFRSHFLYLAKNVLPGRLLHNFHFKNPIPLALPNQKIPIPPGLSEIALGQFGNCLEATTWNSKEVSICNEKEIERASARWEGRTRSILGEMALGRKA